MTNVPGSKIQRKFFRILDALLHFNEESNCFFAVDGAVIVAEREIHHRADFHFPVHRHWARHDFVHPENAALRRIQNRRGEERAINTAIRNGECAALEIFELQFSVTRPSGVIGDVALQIGKTFLIRVAHYRHHKSALRPNGYADVVEVILDEIITVDTAVDDGHSFERFDGRLHKERHQPEFDTVLFCELILLAPAQFLHRAHVAFVECGENRRGVLRHHQLLRDLPTQRRHLFANEASFRLRRGFGGHV